MAFVKFMRNKFFHPHTYENQKRVWIAEQKEASEKKRQEELHKQYLKEQAIYENKNLLKHGTTIQNEKLDFMYEPPMEYRKKEEKLELREVRFEWQKNAPREGAYAKNIDVTDKPFGIEVRNTKCIKCGVWGHMNTDKICPLYNQARKDDNPGDLGKEDPMALLSSLEKGGLRMNKSAVNSVMDVHDGRYKIVKEQKMDPELAFITGLSNKQKRKLLKKLNKSSQGVGGRHKAKKNKKEKKKKKRKNERDSSQPKEISIKRVDSPRRPKKKRRSSERETQHNQHSHIHREEKHITKHHDDVDSGARQRTNKHRTRSSNNHERESLRSPTHKRHSRSPYARNTYTSQRHRQGVSYRGRTDSTSSIERKDHKFTCSRKSEERHNLSSIKRKKRHDSLSPSSRKIQNSPSPSARKRYDSPSTSSRKKHGSQSLKYRKRHNSPSPRGRDRHDSPSPSPRKRHDSPPLVPNTSHNSSSHSSKKPQESHSPRPRRHNVSSVRKRHGSPLHGRDTGTRERRQSSGSGRVATISSKNRKDSSSSTSDSSSSSESESHKKFTGKGKQKLKKRLSSSNSDSSD